MPGVAQGLLQPHVLLDRPVEFLSRGDVGPSRFTRVAQASFWRLYEAAMQGTALVRSGCRHLARLRDTAGVDRPFDEIV